LCTPTAAPPVWLTRAHPEILPQDEHGLPVSDGTRHACCLNSDLFWDYSKKIVRAMAEALGNHPQLIAWQIHNNAGVHSMIPCFNQETRRDWQAWLEAKYGNINRLNEMMGLRFWGQLVNDWTQVPMPMSAPEPHNPALLMDWRRFCSDTIVAFVRMQADLLRELTPRAPTTSNVRIFGLKLDLFDLAGVVDFVSLNSDATIQSKPAVNACEIDFLRSLKKTGSRTPGGEEGFWVIEQRAGHVNWLPVNTLVRPGVVRMFTYQMLSRGADAVLYFFWRQPRIGTEKFYGAILPHNGRGENRVFEEISQIGEELKRLGPALEGTKVVAETCILYSHENDWALSLPRQPNVHFNLRDHLQLFHSALHDRNIPVDFARPSDDLSRYKLVIAPSLCLLSAGDTDALKLYVQNGGILVATCNSGLVDEHHIAADDGYPLNMTDLFGLEVLEFDPIEADHENHIAFKGPFHANHAHRARLWCDVIAPAGCEVLATYTHDFYASRPAVTMNSYGLGKAIYVGTVSDQPFYDDLIAWLRTLCSLHTLLKVPDTVEVSMREKGGLRVFFLVNHHSSAVRITFYKPMHEFLTERTITGNYDLPPHGVLVLDESRAADSPAQDEPLAVAAAPQPVA
jgi:beta-galactosidase